MSNKHKKHQQTPPSTPKDLKARIERSLTEGRSQQALDLARQLYKIEHTPDNRELVKRASLARARHLHDQGYHRDAVTLLETAQQLDPDNPAWLLPLAELLARCGAIGKALALLPSLPEGPEKNRIQGTAADAAVPQQAAGRALLPAPLQADFDRVLQAFREIEAGQDEQARTTLQGIGLRSPFLEWKLLLRGLQAYYQGDDARAQENWQRLDAQRLPARLAAPFRFQIDPTFRAAQSPATQEALQKEVDRFQSSGLVHQLRQLRTSVARRNGLPAAFRQLDTLLPQIRQQAPQLLPRLARFFYWAILKTGPDDVLRYKRVFGTPPDDPNFNRLQALALEEGGDLQEAHEAWERYEKEVAGFSWPAGEVQRARALIWLHMGQNARIVPSKKKLAKMPAFLRYAPGQLEPLDPPAEKCFQKSLELAPDLLEAHEALFLHEIEEDRPARAIKAGQTLLARFPDHVPTLERLARLLQQKGKNEEALELLQRALKNNPLNRRLRSQTSQAHIFCGRAAAEANHFDETRRQYQLALDLDDRPDKSAVLCKWAAAELKAGANARAEELLQQALAQSPSSLDVSFSMLIEVNRLRLDKPIKSRFEKEFSGGLAAPPTPADVVELVKTAGSHVASGVEYTGSKSHFKKVFSWAEKYRNKLDFSEQQLEEICAALIEGNAGIRSIRGYIRQGIEKYYNNPVFHLLEIETDLEDDRGGYYGFGLQQRLTTAEGLIQALPQGPKKDALAQKAAQLKDLIQALNPLGGMPFPFPFSGPFDPFGDYDDDDER